MAPEKNPLPFLIRVSVGTKWSMSYHIFLEKSLLLFTVERKSTRESASGRIRNHIHEWFDYIKK